MRADFAPTEADAVPIHFIASDAFAVGAAALPPGARAAASLFGFEAKAGQHLIIPGDAGAMAAVVFIEEAQGARAHDPFLPGKLAVALPPGAYHFANSPRDPALAALGWLLSAYRFTRYQAQSREPARLRAPEGVDASLLRSIASAIELARDLVNAPANDLGPDALEQAALALAGSHRAQASVIRGEELLALNFPLVHAVGRAASQAPRLVDFAWGRIDAPKVTLVGKGVCFDTGGLNIKPDASMLLMKKDMGGAATALALASMVMANGVDVRLRVILPIVENAISGPAFRPGDIFPSRKGLTVEIGNTDAEGRLILADALALADEDRPELLFDFATLTGAARVALGPDLPPFYTMDDALAADIARHARAAHDPVWRMPLWEPYDAWLDSKVSSLNNVTGGSFAGSITAALFLRRFVEHAPSWAHFDIYAWNPATRPGRPEGGESQAARLLLSLLIERYGRS